MPSLKFWKYVFIIIAFLSTLRSKTIVYLEFLSGCHDSKHIIYGNLCNMIQFPTESLSIVHLALNSIDHWCNHNPNKAFILWVIFLKCFHWWNNIIHKVLILYNSMLHMNLKILRCEFCCSLNTNQTDHSCFHYGTHSTKGYTSKRLGWHTTKAKPQH